MQEAALNWPTPTAKDENTQRHPTEKRQGGEMHESLRVAAVHWPAPAASDEKGSCRVGQRRGQLSEATEQMWPTPRGEDSESAGNHPGAVDSLTGAVMLWPTPDASDGGPRTPDERRGPNPGLKAAAILWDASVSGGKGACGEGELGRERLTESPRGRQGLTSGGSGRRCCSSGHGSRRLLNPVFVAWLMGFPFGLVVNDDGG